MKSTKQIDLAIQELQGRIEKWTGDVDLKNGALVKLEARQSELRSRSLRDADKQAASELAATRPLHSSCVQEIRDLEAEIVAAGKEIDDLKVLRVDAAREESWQHFIVESTKAIADAEDTEKYLVAFFKMVQPHRARMEKLTSLAKAAGLERVTFDTRHLWRKFHSLLHASDPYNWPRVDKVYDGSYADILKHIFDAADRQRSPREKAVANG